MPPAPTRGTLVQEALHFRALRALAKQPNLSQRQLAEQLGVSLGKTNHLLHALVDKGLLMASHFRNSQNKMAHAYLVTPTGLAEKAAMTRGYLNRKLQEYEALRKEIRQIKAELEAGPRP